MRLQVDAWPKNLHVGNGSHRDVFIRGRLAAQSVDPSKGPPDKTRPKGRWEPMPPDGTFTMIPIGSW
jgi:hypothetical protein